MTRHGWNVHGWWVGPPELEPERKPPRARCGGPQLCVICGPTVKTYAPDPEGLPITVCKFCREPIIWAETMPNPNARSAAGRETHLVPFDAEPSRYGNWALTPRGSLRPQCGEMKNAKADAYRAFGKHTFQRHVKTCTQVGKWPKGQYIVKQREKGRA